MGHSSNTPHTNEVSPIQHKREKNIRGATMMAKLIKVFNTVVKLMVVFDIKIGRCYGEHVSKLSNR